MSTQGGLSPEHTPAVPERFEVLEELYEAGGAQLLRARDTLLGREVFLKRPGVGLRAAYCDASLRTRGLREARALASINHPSVERLLDALETAEGPLLVLEPTHGERLQSRLEREGSLKVSEVVEIGIALAGALEKVHEAGIVHRGITAECIVLEEAGRVRLTGFHFAKVSLASGASTHSSLVLSRNTGGGHPAPEQLTKGEDDPRSDLFGLAWVLFESLTGHAPYAGSDPLLWGSPLVARDLVPSVPVGLGRLLAGCLSLSPAGRPQSAASVRRALEPLLTGPATGGLDSDTASRPATAAWALAALSCAVLIVVLIAGRPATSEAGTESASGLRGRLQRETSKTEAAYEPFYERSHALLIGIGDAYRQGGFTPLPNAERDVQAVAATLAKEERFEWDIRLILGKRATEDAIIDAVTQLADRAGRNDRVLIYFAGHGVAHERAAESGYLIPADGESKRRSSWVHFDQLRRFFHESEAKHIMIAMDCCYAGRLTTTRGGPTEGAATAEAYGLRYLTSKAHFVIASGRANEQVSDGVAGRHSPFAMAFLTALGGSGPLTSTGLYLAIQEAFLDKGVVHTPQMGRPRTSAAEGEYVFFRGEK